MSKPKKRRTKNLSNEGDVKPEKIPSRNRPKKLRDLGLVSFFTTYHKTMWTAKYNCAFVYDNDLSTAMMMTTSKSEKR